MKIPNESAEYRRARNELLEAEIALRRQIEQVAAQRRRLPPGGEVPEDYVFEGEQGPMRLSQLFGPRDTLVAYSFMYGPKMAKACPSCTSMRWRSLDETRGSQERSTRTTPPGTGFSA